MRSTEFEASSVNLFAKTQPAEPEKVVLICKVIFYGDSNVGMYG